MFYNGNDILYDGYKNCIQEKYVPWAVEYYTLSGDEEGAAATDTAKDIKDEEEGAAATDTAKDIKDEEEKAAAVDTAKDIKDGEEKAAAVDTAKDIKDEDEDDESGSEDEENDHLHDNDDHKDHGNKGSRKNKEVKTHDVKANWAFAKDLLTFWDDYLVYSDEDLASYMYDFPSHLDHDNVWDLSNGDE
jgi:hypothetical protein